MKRALDELRGEVEDAGWVFGSVDAQHLLEDPDAVIQGNRVLHVRYPVGRR